MQIHTLEISIPSTRKTNLLPLSLRRTLISFPIAYLKSRPHFVVSEVLSPVAVSPFLVDVDRDWEGLNTSFYRTIRRTEPSSILSDVYCPLELTVYIYSVPIQLLTLVSLCTSLQFRKIRLLYCSYFAYRKVKVNDRRKVITIHILSVVPYYRFSYLWTRSYSNLGLRW